MDFHELKVKTVAELREVAKGIDGLDGYTQMNKQTLLTEVCKHLGVEMHEHHEVVGIDKTAIKGRIRELKQERGGALAADDHARYKRAIRDIHKLKRALRRATV